MAVRTLRKRVREGKNTRRVKYTASKKRPVLRPMLWDKLVERMTTLMEKELTWQ